MRKLHCIIQYYILILRNVFCILNQFTDMDKIDVVSIANRELDNRHINHSELARKLSLNPSSVQGMLSRSTLQVQRLLDLSEVCNYNFFREVADLLPYAEPSATLIKSMAIAANEHEERIKELEMEVKILRQTLKDVVGK